MTKRIFTAIFAVAISIFAACLVLIMGVLYNYFSVMYETEIQNEAQYISIAVQSAGEDYLNSLTPSTNRITWIDSDGTVLYDSRADLPSLENHADREEIKQALETGVGESSRYSDTLSEKYYYYALRLDDGTVLRVSNKQYSVISLIAVMAQPILLVAALALILSLILAARISKSITRPINNIDLEHPETADTYDELAPLLRKISFQNKQIQLQIEELSRKQQELATITENMSEGLLVVDERTDILFYNTSALKLLGTDKVDNNQSALTLNRSESFRKAIDKALNSQHNEQLMKLNHRLYQLIANPVHLENSVAGAVILILDITEKEERDKLRREFTANVSHELKTPLTSISGFAEIMKNGIVKEEDMQHFAGKIYDESQRLITLVGDIIKLSQLDENTIEMTKTPVDLYNVIDSVTQRLKHLADKQNISIEINAEHISVIGVEQILDEMIFNLCDNAIKYNKEGGKVFITLDEQNDGIHLSVRDTGIGIPFADRNRVFERFYRVDKSHSKEIGGTGLGLSIVKHGAAYHNAIVSLNSKINNGTEIIIIFNNVK